MQEPDDRIDIILENLRNYTVKHFSDEEQYMESINYKKKVLAKRNFVLAVRGGIFGDKPTAYRKLNRQRSVFPSDTALRPVSGNFRSHGKMDYEHSELGTGLRRTQHYV